MDATKQDLPDKEQESHREDQEISSTFKMKQGNLTSTSNKRNDVVCFIEFSSDSECNHMLLFQSLLIIGVLTCKLTTN